MPTHYEAISSMVSLRNAWIRIKQRNSAAGIDGMTVADFDRDVNRQLQILSDQLQEGKYKPQPYLYVEIPKKKNPDECRRLSMLSVRDKIVQESIKNKDGVLDGKLLALERIEKSFVDFRKQTSYMEDELLTKIIDV